MRTFAVLVLVLVAAVVAAGQGTHGGKDSRTPAQRKINSQLLQEIDRLKHAPDTASTTSVKLDRTQRALVDVRVEVTPEIQKAIRGLEGTVVSTSLQYRSIVAWVPLLKLEELAADDEVRAIAPAPEATIHK